MESIDRMAGRVVGVFLAVLFGVGGPIAAVDTQAWARTLARHAHSGGVDYASLADDREDLDRYVESLAEAPVESWSPRRRMAFWINAYNAVTMRYVVDRWPGIASVQEVPGFFDRLTLPVAGRPRTLDEIEDAARALGDPRVHFAVVCASSSCPDLRPEPYAAEQLERQLEDQTRHFLADPRKGLRYDRDDNTLWLSSIFKWYAGDFTGGSTVVAYFLRGGIVSWVVEHLPAALASELRRRDPDVDYLSYDWGLNHFPRQR